MTDLEWEAHQATRTEHLLADLGDVESGRVAPWNRQVTLAVIVEAFEEIRENVHTRNRWWGHAKRLDELEARINNIPDAKRKRKTKRPTLDRPSSLSPN